MEEVLVGPRGPDGDVGHWPIPIPIQDYKLRQIRRALRLAEIDLNRDHLRAEQSLEAVREALDILTLHIPEETK